MSALWPHGDPRVVARAVLAQRRFRDLADRAPQRSWWDRFWQGVFDFLGRIFHPMGALHGGGRLAEAIGILVFVAMLACVGFAIRRFAPGLFGARRPRVRAARGDVVYHVAGTAAALRARAGAAEAAGDHREAATLLWSSLLHALDERGRTRYDSARTPGEWRRIVRDRTFDGVARDATAALFADDPIDAELVARMNERYDTLVAP